MYVTEAPSSLPKLGARALKNLINECIKYEGWQYLSNRNFTCPKSYILDLILLNYLSFMNAFIYILTQKDDKIYLM